MKRRPFAHCKPLPEITRFQNNWLAIVDRLHNAVRFCRKDRERLLPLVRLWVFPRRPDSGHAKKFSLWNCDLVLWFRSFPCVLPLEERGCRNDAAVLDKLVLPELRGDYFFRADIKEEPVR